MPNYTVPKITLQTPAFQPATFQPVTYAPQVGDLSLLSRSLDKIEERKDKTLQQRANILNAINNVNLDQAENDWKQRYTDKIMADIDSAAQLGDYSTALNVATTLAGNAISSPELRGRERYYNERQKWLDELKSRRDRNDINYDTYERALVQNPYAYRDTYNDEGVISGGISWNPEFNPVKDINLNEVFDEIQKRITPSATGTGYKGGISQTWLDANGNVTKDPTKAVTVQTQNQGGGRSNTYTGVTEEQWEAAYNAWKSEHPEADLAFAQKMANDEWKYNQLKQQIANGNLSEEETTKAQAQLDTIKDRLQDDNGVFITNPDIYVKRLANPMFKTMAWSKTVDEVVAGSTLLDDNYLKNKQSAANFAKELGFNLDGDIYSLTQPTIITMQNAVENGQITQAQAKAALQVLIEGLQGKSFDVTETPFNKK